MDDHAPHDDMTDPLRLVVLVGSVRTHRVGQAISRWVCGRLTAGGSRRLEVHAIDLKHITLPADELLQPGGSQQTDISQQLQSADAFVFIAPEYNASIPARLKSAIDWHYREWSHKPALIVSYGALGGHMAAHTLRVIFAELSVVTPRRYLALARPWEMLHEQGFDPGPGTDEALAQATEDLLWWAETLRDGRRARPVTAG